MSFLLYVSLFLSIFPTLLTAAPNIRKRKPSSIIHFLKPISFRIAPFIPYHLHPISLSRSNSAIPTNLLTPTLHQHSRGGLTGDSCVIETDCQFPRSCLSIFTDSSCESCETTCRCFPEDFEKCNSTSDCSEGESCAKSFEPIDGNSLQSCYSSSLVSASSLFIPVTLPDQPAFALSGESCADNNQCISPRVCDTSGSGPNLCVNPSSLRICLRDLDCNTEGEICAFNTDGSRYCISKNVIAFAQDLFYISLTGEPCFLDTDCLDSRICRAETGADCGGVGDNCRCKPLAPQTCASNEDCTTDGEVCATCAGSGKVICISEFAADQDPTTTKLPCAITIPSPDPGSEPAIPTPQALEPLDLCRALFADPDLPPTPIPSIPSNIPAISSTPPDIPATSSDPPGMSSDPTSNDPDLPPTSIPSIPCNIPAISSTPPDIPATSSDPPGMFSDPTSAISVQPTPSGESTTSPQQIDPGVSPTISVQPVPSEESAPEETDSGVCIDAGALRHLDASELVFETHSMARVLCDLNESCATPGHIVQFEGMALRMSSYCKMVRCSEKVMYVNSPRYRKRLRIKSKTDGLLFTALAARYNTRAEEVLLAAVVHMEM